MRFNCEGMIDDSDLRASGATATWTIVVTNVPRELLNVEEAMLLARLRWQIELLFKLWKSHGGIDEWSRQVDPSVPTY